ncbi:hypothetical protein [Agreia bicolorata]|uniref:Uncharacterized protein n=1 Tax=Agreia bicolorata TaxID=110935 RepID=A0ABR5CD40_9MICO|nr:hypothetical protein [Agreia bicolorata]KJC63541.1 hypothetical protein TZ00_13340 [Agreia bicolorata]
MIEVEIRVPSRETGEYFATTCLCLRDDGGFEAVGVWKWIIPLRIPVDDGNGLVDHVSLWDDPEFWLLNLGIIMDTDSHVPVVTELAEQGRPVQVEMLNETAIAASIDGVFRRFIPQGLEPSRRDVVELLSAAGYRHPPTNAVNSVLAQTIGWPVRYSVSEAADKLAIWIEEKEIRDDEQ